MAHPELASQGDESLTDVARLAGLPEPLHYLLAVEECNSAKVHFVDLGSSAL
ncbi:hypothetical protein FOMPIDRAFT_93099 [Fomitopsis schrenkii]|uniref:Uncharacterized protein n=1 Tax=Fomitopsis schrenkii TaxID=2126942 RepID=S8EVD7_FOMSC|nr:hypothetical protein FOMPIDRAFT_93099 [Fomitopsis schrenkii]